MSMELTEEELNDFKSSPDYQEFADITSSLDQLEGPEYNEKEALAKVKWQIQNKKENKGRLISLRKFAVFATAACIIVLLGVGLILELTNAPLVELTATVPELVDLPDGSTVNVNKGSSISYVEGWWNGHRTVALKGEAFFNVEKGTEFTVNAGSSKVTVLGTSFNVLENNGLLMVTCYTGKVKVESAGHEVVLTAGRAFRIGTDLMPDSSSTHLTKPTWVSRIINLNNATIDQAVSALKKHYHIKVIGDFESEISYQVKFPLDDIEVALKQVFGPANINYTYNKENNTITIEQ
ncbi:MAG: FecR domain-containing protein [Flavobacteriales bacterium]|nr:FecR domain-containing protein [Flavobacteriales bacterium]